jgi:hypothetical protein
MPIESNLCAAHANVLAAAVPAAVALEARLLTALETSLEIVVKSCSSGSLASLDELVAWPALL